MLIYNIKVYILLFKVYNVLYYNIITHISV